MYAPRGWTAEEMEEYGAKLAATRVPLVLEDAASAEVMAQIKAAQEVVKLQLEMEGERVRNDYGEVTDNQVIEILKAEREKKQCEGCKGLPCQKRSRKCFVPSIGYSAELKYVDIYHYLCKYEMTRRNYVKLQKKFGLAKIPAEYLGKTFEDYKVDANNSYAVEVAKALIEKPNNGAYFYGSVGTGKTLLAAIMAQEILRAGREVAFATVPTISMKIRSTFKQNANVTESDVLEKLFTIPTLILDDIGMEKPTRFICSMLANIFNERYNARLQTIMTSNYKLKELETIFNNPTDGEPTFDGTRIYDRCKQMCVPVELKGKSRRC